MKNIPTITINAPNKPININVPNTGGGGNPFVNWGSAVNFGGNTGVNNIPNYNPPYVPPSMNIPNNIPTGNTTSVENSIIPNVPQTISGNTSQNNDNNLDYSNKNLTGKDVEKIPAKDGCYELVSFKNNNIGCESLQHLIYSEEGQTALTKGSSDLKEIYQGMLAKQGVMIVNLDYLQAS